MFSRNLNLVLRISPRRVITQLTAKNSTANAVESTNDKDPAPYFFNQEVQNLLKTVTRADPDKVFRRQLDGRKLEAPEYKFMTDAQLQNAMLKAENEMWEMLQMPPVVKVRQEESKILSQDPALQGLFEGKYVFTDITFGISNKKRIIAIRESNGTLRTATNKERDRLNQVYHSAPGREVEVPKMFQEEYLEAILDREDYEFILNRACLQFDPDHEDYHRITQITYDRIDEKMHFQRLRSTRHFGPMVFYLAWNKKIDNLILENIIKETIQDAALVLKLYYILHPSENAKQIDDSIKLIQHYIKTDAISKELLDTTLKVYLEVEEERTKVEKTTKNQQTRKIKDSDEEIKT